VHFVQLPARHGGAKAGCRSAKIRLLFVAVAKIMARQVVLPSPALLPYVRTFMGSDFACLRAHLPANADVQLVAYLRGGAFVTGADGAEQRLPQAFVVGATMAPRLFRVEPGSRFVAATFRPAGVHACLGIPAHVLAGQMVPLEQLLAAGEAEALLERLLRASGLREQAAQCERVLLRALLAGQGRSPLLPRLSLDGVLLPAAELAGRLAISTRQLERRFLVHYGVPLRDYRRLARFSMALAALMTNPPQAGSLARIAQESRYADQAHFTNDFRRFVGTSPGKFIEARDRPDSIYRLWQLDAGELAAFTE
jgi:AraC-like DNA-binding protein